MTLIHLNYLMSWEYSDRTQVISMPAVRIYAGRRNQNPSLWWVCFWIFDNVTWIKTMVWSTCTVRFGFARRKATSAKFANSSSDRIGLTLVSRNHFIKEHLIQCCVNTEWRWLGQQVHSTESFVMSGNFYFGSTKQRRSRNTAFTSQFSSLSPFFWLALSYPLM